jgi:DNA-binding beta-propeller fold protein YncE
MAEEIARRKDWRWRGKRSSDEEIKGAGRMKDLQATRWLAGLVFFAGILVGGCGGGGKTAAGVTVSPNAATVLTSRTQLFTATVTGVSSSSVTWGVSQGTATPITGGNSTLGTITTTGFYTAPATIPNPNTVTITATSTIDTKATGTSTVTVDSGIRVKVLPASDDCTISTPSNLSIGTGEQFQFKSCVTGTATTSVSWAVNGTAGGSSTLGTISASGLYTAPTTPPSSVTITATSTVDPNQSGSIKLSVTAAADPTLASIEPSTAAQGSIQQDIYLTGTNFFSTSQVLAGSSANNITTTFISSTLLRARLLAPLLLGAGPLPISVQRQNGDVSPPVNLTVQAVRPAIISSSPDSVPKGTSSPNVTLTGGYFTISTAGEFNGQPQIVSPPSTDPRHLTVNVSGAALGTPGLYSLVIRNPGVPTGTSAITSTNLAVSSTQADIPTAVKTKVSVGASPSAIAINAATAMAVVADTGSNSISLIDLSNINSIPPPTSVTGVGNSPTSVAIDDLLNEAVVVSNTGNSLTFVSLGPPAAITGTLSLSGVTPVGSAPFAVGINPLSHRAIVVNQSTNTATIIELTATTACTTPPCVLTTIGGSANPISTGTNPSVAIDPRLNWAIVTPGGAGTISIVDLGRPATAGDGGRTPGVVATFSLSITTEGVAVNSETHQVLVTDPNNTVATLFSALDNTPASITTLKGDVAAAVNPLTDVGVTVNTLSGLVTVFDLRTQLPLSQPTIAVGSKPVAAAIDPGGNVAAIVNQGDGTVSILPLGPIRPLHVVDSSPDKIVVPGSGFPAPPPACSSFSAPNSLTMMIAGTGFVAGPPGSTVRLDEDGTVATSHVVSGREICATIPAAKLISTSSSSARRFMVDVQNPDSTVSNASALTVIQAVAVGTSPQAVAVDPDRELAVVTNAGDCKSVGTVSIVNLTTGTTNSVPLSVGTCPEGVAALPSLGRAVVTNNADNTVSILDIVNQLVVNTVSPCSSCAGPMGVAIDGDTQTAVVANFSSNNIASFSAQSGTAGSSVTVDAQPLTIAVDPTRNFAAVGTASQTSTLNFVNLSINSLAGRLSGLQLPSGIAFDPVSENFLVAESLRNTVDIVDPATQVSTPMRVGINPTSLDYNFQTSTLVTMNTASNTISVTDFLAQRVRAVLGLAGGQNSQATLPGGAPPLPQASLAIDPRTNVAVIVDQNNNRVLLVPLPQ